MRDTSDMMEDVLSEDTMMDCGNDDALYDLIDLSTDISHSAPTIKDAAERLLTLLGVQDDDDDDARSSSEDEGVELDEETDDDDDDDDDEKNSHVTENARLLRQLATSLAQELKHSHKPPISSATPRSIPINQRNSKLPHETTRISSTLEQINSMEISQENFHENISKSLLKNPLQNVDHFFHDESTNLRNFGEVKNFGFETSTSTVKFCEQSRLEIDGIFGSEDEDENNAGSGSIGSWIAGWDACANEAVRYLVEEEGLSKHHPTVVAMKNHLTVQREKIVSQFAI